MDFLDQMKTFVNIVDRGKLAGAARGRGMSVAAVSRQLSALERELGTKLVVRSTRQLAVTESGRRWYEHCTRILAELDTARAEVASETEIRGSVIISAPVSYALAFVVPVIAKLAAQHPKLTIELRPQDQAVDLLGEGVDVAIRVGMTLPDTTAIVARRIRTFRRSLLGSAAYLRKHGMPKDPDELVEHQLILHARAAPSFTTWKFTRGDEVKQVRASGRLSSTSPVVLRAWAMQGLGLILVPEFLGDGLRVVLPAWKTDEISAYAIHRAEVRNAARIRTVVDALT